MNEWESGKATRGQGRRDGNHISLARHAYLKSPKGLGFPWIHPDREPQILGATKTGLHDKMEGDANLAL